MKDRYKIDVTSGMAEKGIEAVTDFANKLIGPAIEETGLLIGDQIRSFRFRNQVKVLKRAEKLVLDKKIKIKQIPVKVLVPLLEGASLEEDENLQEKWANLLVNYVDTEKNLKTTVFPYILGQLSTEEVKALEILKKQPKADIFKLELSGAEISNLHRLGLINLIQLPPEGVVRDYEDDTIVEYKDDFIDIKYEMSELGDEFVDNCKVNKTNIQ